MYVLSDGSFSPGSLESSHDCCWGLSGSSDEYLRLPKTLQGKLVFNNMNDYSLGTHQMKRTSQVLFLRNASRTLGLLSQLYLALSRRVLCGIDELL
jgi:hypothetical protein